MPFGRQVDLGPGHVVLDGDPVLPTERDTAAPHFSPDVYCDQTAGRIRIPLGTEVGLGRDDIVLDGTQLPSRKGKQHPHFSAHVYCGQPFADLSSY